MKLQTYLLIPDTHIPYHDQKAWDLVMKVARDLTLHGIVLLGDFCDFYAVSSHSKNPIRATEFAYETQQVRKKLTELDNLNAKHKVYVGGNHEDRLVRYLRDKAPELHDVISMQSLFKLEKRGWEYIDYKEDYTIGRISFTHDVGTAGRYSVYRCLDTYQHSIVTGHTHRLGYTVEGDATGTHKISAQFGWLGDVNEIDYMHKASAKKNWVPGFGLMHYNPKTKLGYLVPVPIVNYTAVVNGKLYK